MADWNKKEWSPAFGKALTPNQMKKEAKKMGLTEVGNESADKIASHFDKQREEKYKSSWDEINTNLGEVK